MVATHRASLTRRAVLHAMRQQHNLSRIVTHATRALGWRVVCVVLSLAFAAIHMRPAPTHATDAGVDGDHIFAGVSYESYGSYERCSWVRPVTIHEQGVSPAVITREWQGLTWSLYICEVDGDFAHLQISRQRNLRCHRRPFENQFICHLASLSCHILDGRTTLIRVVGFRTCRRRW